MILDIAQSVGLEKRGETVEFDVLDKNGRLHTLRIATAAFRGMVTDAMLCRLITRSDLDKALSAAAKNLNIGERQ